MANLLDRIITRVGGSTIKKIVDEKVKEEVSKANAVDIMRFSPSSYGLQRTTNEKPFSLGVGNKTLREFADFYPIARACVEYRKTQITHLDWAITPVEITDETVQDKKNIENSKKLKQLFKYPTGKKDSSFTNWIKQILEDLLVIDAVAIYRKKNRRGDIIGYLPVDGATIVLKLENDGTTPEPPAIAYIQKINGQEVAELTTEDLIYAMMNPRTHSAYGLAPLESLIITVTTALKLQAYSLGFLTEGNIPEGFVTLPRDIASSRDQLKEWQEAWDAMLSGDPRFQRKLKFLPEGMKYQPARQTADMTFERFEKWLLQTTCSAFGLHPSAIGFNFDVNRSSAQSLWEAGRERGLFPTALFLKEIMDRMVQDDLGHPELQFTWTNIDPTNKVDEAKVVTSLINAGLMAVDEWRLGEGLKPIGIKDPFIMTPVGPMFLKDLAAQSAAGQQPIAPYKPPTQMKPSDTNRLPIPSQARASQGDYIQEIRKWKKVALNDFKNKKPIRDFETDIIDKRTCDLIKSELTKVKDKEEIRGVFRPFIEKKHLTNNALLSLYDGIDDIISKDGRPEKSLDQGTSLN